MQTVRPSGVPRVVGTSERRRILGIDPGLNTTGYGVIDIIDGSVKLVEAGVVRSTASRNLAERVAEIHEGVSDVITSLKPSAMAIEQLYSHYERPRTAILMGHARGVLILAAIQHGVTVHHYAATQIKKILTGSGRATKEQMQWAICRQLGLTTAPEPADVADALAGALTHHFLDRPGMAELRS